MDKVYRGQRHIYDFTRKYYLFGRDRLIRELDAAPGMSVLEVGCGTGRNLELIARAWPQVQCHGFDISSEMLKSARARLGPQVRLAPGDATRFDASALFGRAGFDRVVLSYTLSMIPDWQAALEQAAAALAPGGVLHAVDFGDLAGLPSPLRKGLRAWLAKFHVSPRLDLPMVAARLAGEKSLRIAVKRGPLGYYQLVQLSR
ncbi:MAG: class I SAM-dependent methyltransferase [Novosphingobium sp.]|nr:class I SAM-dependent methyltransferase [Novosphingobium sp.]